MAYLMILLGKDTGYEENNTPPNNYAVEFCCVGL